MDLTGQGTIKSFWDYDAGTDMLTLTFMSDDELTTFGTIQIEGNKFRSFVEPLLEVGKDVLFPDTLNFVNRIFHRSTFDNTLNRLTTEFE